MAHRQLGQIFVDLGFLDEQALEKLVIDQEEQRPDEMIGQLAMEAELITDNQLAEALAEQMGLQVVKLEDGTPAKNALEIRRRWFRFVKIDLFL